jgi:hypothetical protein
MKKTNLFQINTTAFDEEDFLLQTTLTSEQIERVIQPIVLDERDNGVEYDNDSLCTALQEAYPMDLVVWYNVGQIDLISV